MVRFIIRRLLSLIPTLFLIITFSFFIMKAAPGGPFSAERNIPPEILANINKAYHFDEPVYKQYLRYLGNVLRGDLGPSFRYKDYTVNDLIANTLPNSLILGITALCIALFFGIFVGLMSAVKQNSIIDYLTMSVAVIGISIPLFVVGPLLMLVFAVQLKWLPTSGWITGRQGLKTLIMPAVTLSLPYFAYIARLSRASVLEVLRSDYIRTAYAKGLSYPLVLFKHALKGAMLPVISYLGPAFAGIITGSVVIEKIFLVPGLGTFFVQSALNRDYTLIMGTVIVYSIILILMNFIVDIVYAAIDPRISYK
ncbi:oligopeptide ABC transporter permease OppB [Treponema phagedenis]|uniref:Oligopeptide ABC transporter permease OppB n=1 Tax=Treponema phagedenis TaxID=162 RepID=A0A0B7GQB3_TREPH|nr:oligopeptide ABC transporter permease OppB [Treponema phagedenis]NVP23381.1 oligopeptide ABC transporter permease OppB [Treponema phagedenis]QEJ95601.1 oligopeptide ABC transporter permease OppB [Treponema phagedenis]QEJ98523.1 oligopeptide ABC transporter permease OppB [Treponema phagedenis]QEK01454.1 oligopeptide ABC transporter permease OppB [Treponema phagedenis]QEK04030.1 oligopeptide ABC transporter permease OppB [Treponema phagedenis]